MGASRYIFQLDNLTTGQNAIIRENFVSTNSHTIAADLEPGEYRAWVQAVSQTTNLPGPWGFNIEFTVTELETETPPALLILQTALRQSSDQQDHPADSPTNVNDPPVKPEEESDQRSESLARTVSAATIDTLLQDSEEVAALLRPDDETFERSTFEPS